MKKLYIYIFVFLDVFILGLIFSAYFFNGGITSYAIYDFEENKDGFDLDDGSVFLDYDILLDEEFEFTFYNGERKNMQVLFTVIGDLNDSVFLFDNLVDFLPSEESKMFKYRVKLNGELEPGLHNAKILALEIPRNQEEYVGSRSSVVFEVNIYVPYPDKYVESDLDIINAEKGEKANLIVKVVNRGSEIIENVRSKIYINTLLGENVAIVDTDSNLGSLGVKESLELSGIWDVNVNPGDYVASYEVFYDSESRVFEKSFLVGSRNISILGVLVNNFQLGEIAKLQILIENGWNKKLEDVYAKLIIYGGDGEVLADIRSSDEEIDSLSKKELVAYWDTDIILEGDYNSKLSVFYGDNEVYRDLVLKVSEDNLEIFGVGYTVRQTGGRANMTNMFLVIVIFLLLLNLAWFIFFRRNIGRLKIKG